MKRRHSWAALALVLIIGAGLIGCGAENATTSNPQAAAATSTPARDTSSMERALIGHWENPYYDWYFDGSTFWEVAKGDGWKSFYEYRLGPYVVDGSSSPSKMTFWQRTLRSGGYDEVDGGPIWFLDEYTLLIMGGSTHRYVDSQQAP